MMFNVISLKYKYKIQIQIQIPTNFSTVTFFTHTFMGESPKGKT